MSPKGFAILAIVAAVSVVGAGVAVKMQPDYGGSKEAGTKVFPNLMERVDLVARIQVVHPEKTLNMKRQGDGWLLAEADDYPATTKNVNKFLLDLAQLTLYEPKTKSKDLWEKLWVDDPQRKGGQAKHVTLFDKDGKIIQEVIVGRTKYDVDGSTTGGAYIRRANEDQAWLAKGDIDANYEPRNMFERAFMDMNVKRVKKVVLRHPNGEEIRISKDDPAAEHYKVDNLPAGRKLRSEFEPDDIGTVFAGFRVDDVVKAEKKVFPADQTTVAEYETFDGMTIKARLYIEGEVHWMTFEAGTLPGIAPAEAGKDDPVKDAETINKNAKGWAYDISSYRVTALKKKMADMLAEEPKAGS